MIDLKATHVGAMITTEHVEPGAVEKAHAIAGQWSRHLKRELTGERILLDTTADGFRLTVETRHGDDAVLRVFAMLASLPAQLHGAGVRWGGPGG